MEMMNLDNCTTRLAVSIPEVATMLGISRSEAYRLTSKKGFPVFMVGSRLMVGVDELKMWIHTQTTGGI